MPPGGRPAKGQTGGPVDAAEDYRRKTEREISIVSRRMKAAGHPAPLGDPTTGVVLVIEQPVGPRVLDALAASLAAVGPGAAREVDGLDHPLARAPFSEAEEGVPFAWTRGTSGLLLPSLSPALTDDTRKRRFWRCFLALKDLAA